MGLFSRSKKNESSIGAAVRSSCLSISRQALPAMENAPFWTCTTKLCRIYATLPLHVYSRQGSNTDIDRQSPLSLLLENPCPYMNRYTWRFIMQFNFEVFGIALAIIDKTRAGDPFALYPVSPRTMEPFWSNGSLFWRYQGNGAYEVIPDERVLRFDNTPMSFTGALCPVDYAKADLDVAFSSQELQKNYFSRATTLGGVVTVPKNTSDVVKNKLSDMFKGEFAGSANSYKTIVLEDGLRYEPIRLSDSDTSKMTEAQSYTLQQVAARFGVPPFFLGDMSKATYANSEQQGMDLVTYAIQPRAIAIEDGWSKLCDPAKGQFVRYSLQGLMRGDHSSRAAFYHNAIADGWMSINEVRRLEDLNPVKDGDQHFFPMNYTTLDKVGVTPSSAYESKVHSESKVLNEKRQREILFVEATKAVSKSARAQVEKEIRKQLKAEIELLHSLVGEGATFNTLADQFKEEVSKMAEDFGIALEPIFEGIMNRLVPIVKKQVGSAAEVDEDSTTACSKGYAKDVAQRHIKERIYAIVQLCKKATNETFESDIDELTSDWIATVPSEESTEETRRAGNYFNVSLFQLFGVTTMHVVASADSCEFCQGLDGKVVSVKGTFLAKGEEVKDGEGNVRIINKNYRHPPFHTHCECGVAPGR